MSGEAETNARVVRDCFRAYETGDRELLEQCLADDLEFFSPADPGIDRAQYFERCWPNSGQLAGYEFKRLIPQDDEVLVTYEAQRQDGTRFRNTEVHTLRDGKISRVEVYFGWNL